MGLPEECGVHCVALFGSIHLDVIHELTRAGHLESGELVGERLRCRQSSHARIYHLIITKLLYLQTKQIKIIRKLINLGSYLKIIQLA